MPSSVPARALLVGQQRRSAADRRAATDSISAALRLGDQRVLARLRDVELADLGLEIGEHVIVRARGRRARR